MPNISKRQGYAKHPANLIKLPEYPDYLKK